MRVHAMALCLVATLIATVFMQPADAQSFRDGSRIIGSVTIDVSGRSEPLTMPVRLGRNGGREVLVPRWGWTDCGFSCRGALESHYGENLWHMLDNKDAPETNILNDLFRLR